jgi:magnesium-transporting ATPase (P-type)
MTDQDKASLDDLDDFANQGLRTLVYAYKELPNYTADQIENLRNEDVEKDFTLLGVTGVEDLLQDDVKSCITGFKDAGIRVWILTGDKDATANQIGISCGVLSTSRTIVQIENIDETTDATQWIGKDILISGQVISELLEQKKSKKNNMIDNLISCEGLVVYRSSPSQKADIVRFVRS